MPGGAEIGLDVALVADDLTGALDASASFAARGLRVRVVRGADALPAPPDRAGAALPFGNTEPPLGLSGPSAGSVLAVSTASRHLAPAAARAAVEAAGRRLAGWSPRLVFKKIDSTLRGPVVDEAAGAMAAFGRDSALVCPAFPAAGRVVRGGEVFVHGEPLGETEYVHDLRTPAPAESLEALFAKVAAVRMMRPEDAYWTLPAKGVAIADAETEAHLASLATLVEAHSGEVLAVGSDGLAAGLAERLGRSGPPAQIQGGGGRGVLFALGSRAGTTVEQTERLLLAHPDTPVVEAPGGVLDADAVVRAAASAPGTVVRVPPSPRGEPDTVVRRFAAGIRTAIDGLGGPGRIAALVVTGGDTVEAILDAFDIVALDVLGEFRPGIPVSRGVADRAELTLVSKAGGFGTPSLFAEIAEASFGP